MVKRCWETTFRLNPNLRGTLHGAGIYRSPQSSHMTAAQAMEIDGANICHPMQTIDIGPSTPASIQPKKKNSIQRLNLKTTRQKLKRSCAAIEVSTDSLFSGTKI